MRLEDMALSIPQRINEGWTIIGVARQLGFTELQWDGGPVYAIHGQSTRHVTLEVARLLFFKDAESYQFRIQLLAEKYRREVIVPVNLRINGELLHAQFPELPEWI